MEKRKEYNDIVARIRNIEPVLEGGDELSARIMGRIEKLPAGKSSRRGLLVSGGISVAAAIFLVGLMISEAFLPPETVPFPDISHVNRREHLREYDGMSKGEIIRSVSERRKKNEERNLIINEYSQKL